MWVRERLAGPVPLGAVGPRGDTVKPGARGRTGYSLTPHREARPGSAGKGELVQTLAP